MNSCPPSDKHHRSPYVQRFFPSFQPKPVLRRLKLAYLTLLVRKSKDYFFQGMNTFVKIKMTGRDGRLMGSRWKPFGLISAARKNSSVVDSLQREKPKLFWEEK